MRKALLVVLLSLLSFASAFADDSSQSGQFIQLLKNARLIDLGHTWEIKSPVASVNPFYSFILSPTHGDTLGAFKDGNQLSFTAEVQHFSGQHGAPSIDAIGHIGRDGKLFGGVDAIAATSDRDGIGASGVGRNLGIDSFPTDLIINRGVLLDVAAVLTGDPAKPLEAGYIITAKDLERTAHAHGVKLRKGDTVFIRTGWGPFFKSDPDLYKGDFSPGPQLDAAEFLIRHGARVVGNDTLTFERRPPIVEKPRFQVFPVHMRLIADKGIYIIENLNLEELAKARAYEFAVVVPPLKVSGGTGSALRAFALLP